MNHNFLGAVPEDERTLEICKHFIVRNSWNIMFVPVHFVTQEFCQFAFDQNNYDPIENEAFISLIPEEFRTLEMCERELYADNPADDFLNFVPKKIYNKGHVHQSCKS